MVSKKIKGNKYASKHLLINIMTLSLVQDAEGTQNSTFKRKKVAYNTEESPYFEAILS